jgi:uncharacterized RDD family membrane protein YckC
MNGTLFCTKCGAANPASAQFCSACGASNAPAGPTATTPTPAPAAPNAAVGAYAGGQAGAGYGGFWIRVVAALIDGVLVRVVLTPFRAVLGLGGLAAGGFGHRGFSLMSLVGGGLMLLLTIPTTWLYCALMESSSYQATLGKMIFGMKVTDLYGNRISFARATGRHFAKILSGLILCIGFIMVGLSERKQGLHDLLAGTLVRRS